MATRPSPITRWLERAPAGVFGAFAIGAAFVAYFSMYGLRRPFAAGTYGGAPFAGTALELKTAYVLAQGLGYLASKWLGIKICSEVRPEGRARLLVGLAGAALAALLGFALLPPPWGAVALVANGLPLGMVWGLVVLYLEGRRTSEVLLAGLSVSYVVASGAVKTVALWLMRDAGVPERWMPVTTGALFFVPFVGAVLLLDLLPRPTAEDEALRVRRVPMDGAERWTFLRAFLPGMLLLLGVYLVLTAYRDYRDNYMVEVLAELGHGRKPELLTLTELPVGVLVLVALALLATIRDNRRGLLGAYVIMGAGVALLGGSTALLDAGVLRGDVWIFLTGLGAYLAYVPFGSVLFDRTIAATRVSATAVFAIYLADAVGYSGSVALQLWKDLGAPATTRLEFFRQLSYAMAAAGLVGLGAALAWFLRRAPRSDDTAEA